ncbi:MAG: DUF4266 domain-containing protein [Bacteroidota bacterium]
MQKFIFFPKRHNIRLIWILLLLSPIGLSSCLSVKAYQKMYLNDEDMLLKVRSIELPELSFESYREGASGANKGKTGGGCGCN